MRCRRYVIVTAYLPQSAAWTRTLRRLVEAGAEVVSKDEVSRRIVVEAPRSRAEAVVGILVEEGASLGVEVKALCRGTPEAREVARSLSRAGFLVQSSRGGQARRVTAYGVVRGRYVMVLAWGRRVAVKLGRDAKAGRVTMVPPPGVFVHGADGVGRLLESLDLVLEDLRGMI